MIGKTLGPYEILEPLGAGGMGEVYRARDSTLKRDVAIKLLPEAMASDPERVARLKREAHSLAALTHPNVAVIHGLEETYGVVFLVLELVEGATLEDRLRAGPMAVDEALRIAGQIAEGLEAAHGAGIIHRDLKPANVKITPEARVKVLDFGLAKPSEAKSCRDEESLTRTPTITVGATGAGVLLGTAAYMSPEQARGRPLDKRTDIWSFGCVLYEMLTGTRAFARETVSDTLAAILEHEPDWSVLPPDVPTSIRNLLHRCLRGDAYERLHDIADARIEIAELHAPHPDIQTPEPASAMSGRRWRWLWGVAGVIAGAIAVSAASRLLAPNPARTPDSPRRIPLTDILTYPGIRAFSVSPDGGHLAYSPIGGSSSKLLLRSLNQLELAAVPVAEPGYAAIFSPDSQQLAFDRDGVLAVIDIAGGEPFPVVDVGGTLRGAAWGAGGLVFSAKSPDGHVLQQVQATGGAPEILTTLDVEAGEQSHRFPHFLPNGTDLIFTIWSGGPFDESTIALLSLSTGEWKSLFEGGTDARYVSTGHLIYGRSSALMAVRFDLDSLEVSGTPTRVLENLHIAGDGPGSAHFTVSTDGTLVYRPFVPRQREVLLVDRDGVTRTLDLPLRPWVTPRFSPDGESLLLSDTQSIWVHDLRRDTATRLTTGETRDMAPVWVDNDRVVFARLGRDAVDIVRLRVDSTSDPEPLITGGPAEYMLPGDVRDGTLLYYRLNPVTTFDIWELTSEGVESLLVKTATEDAYPRFSPNGDRIAYRVSGDGGGLFVASYPSGPMLRVTSSGRYPAWGPNGSELFYRDGTRLMVVALNADMSSTVGSPRILLDGDYETSGTWAGSFYDISPDGETFVMLRRVATGRREGELMLIPNWFEELKRLAPPDQ